jgi:putative hydrolase of the HAD superfamily
MRCACVLHANLPVWVQRQISPSELLPAMLACLRFSVFCDVRQPLVRLRQRGLILIVLSNWDISLRDVLGQLGLLSLLDGVLTSAQVGHPKPERAIFRAALDLAGVGPTEALHVGDSLALDVRGAERAGIAAVLLRRGRTAQRSSGSVARISTLKQLPALACASGLGGVGQIGG